jgi:uncharacterized protein
MFDGAHRANPATTMSFNARIIIAALATAATAACESNDAAVEQREPPNLGWRSATVRVVSARDTSRLLVELASSAEQRTMGLMERRSLPDTAGMLFLYPTDQPNTSAFWMYRTRIPLDIAFIDSAGIIRSTQTMQPCPATLASGCPSYAAGAAYRVALEVNAGYFARHHVAVGDKVLLSDTNRVTATR